MFELYTESARRVLFFARYEASQFGGASIGTDHLLLGLTREAKGVICEVFAISHVSLKTIRSEIERSAAAREKQATSVELPFSDAAKRALQYAAEEAGRLAHRYIGPEHLLLGLMRDETDPAAAILIAQGLRLDAVRLEIVNVASGLLSARAHDAGEHVERVKRSVMQLASTPSDAADAQQLVESILRDLDALKRRFAD